MLPQRLVVALVAGVVALAGMAQPATASDAAAPLESIPPEPDVVLLPGPVLGAATVDLDGDGRRELVRLVLDTGAGGGVGVETWKLIDDEWRLLGERRVLERERRIEEHEPRSPFAAPSEMVTVVAGEPARVLVLRDGDRERALAVVTGEASGRRSCCLTVWEVGASELTMLPVVGTSSTASTALAVDMTGDGRDELVVTTPPSMAGIAGTGVALYRVAPDRVEVIAQSQLPISESDVVPTRLGSSTGRPGEEVGIVAGGETPVLHRLALEDGQLIHDAVELPVSGQIAATGLDGGPEILLSGSGTLVLGGWPPGGDFEERARFEVSGRPFPLGDAGQRFFAVDNPPQRVIRVLSSDLLPRASFSTAVAARHLSGPLRPFIGALPGGDRAGRSAAVIVGRLLAVPDGVTNPTALATPIGSLSATQPVGFAGDGEWIALLHTLGPWLDLEPEGGTLGGPLISLDARLSIVPAAVAMRREQAGGRFQPPVSAAIELDRPGLAGEHRLIADPDGFVAELEAPPGSRAIPIRDDGSVSAELGVSIVGPDGRAFVAIPPSDPSAGSYAARLVVLTPAGHAYTANWLVEVRSAAPALSAHADGLSLSFRVPVSGRTEAGMAITIDGEPVPVAADGSFSAEVPAAPWPTTVVIEGRDPLGHQVIESLSVVAVADYRLLPWTAIIVVLTIGAAIAVFLRAPQTRPPDRRPRADEGLVEELGDGPLR